MCCEDCFRYEVCEEDDLLKDDCCPTCPEYYNCMGVDEIEDDSFMDL